MLHPTVSVGRSRQATLEMAIIWIMQNVWLRRFYGEAKKIITRKEISCGGDLAGFKYNTQYGYKKLNYIMFCVNKRWLTIIWNVYTNEHVNHMGHLCQDLKSISNFV